MAQFPPYTRDRQSTWPWTSWGLPASSRVTFPAVRDYALDPGDTITTDAGVPITDVGGAPVFTDDASVTVEVVELFASGGSRRIATHRWSVDLDGSVRLRLFTAPVA